MLQLRYFPLIWMCHSRKLNNRINKLHESTLRLAYNDKSPSFWQFLERDKSVTINERNIQVLLTEVCKVKSEVAPDNLKNLQSQRSFT